MGTQQWFAAYTYPRHEKKVAEYLIYKPTWAAGHIGADGRKTWAEVVTTNPAQARKP